MNTTTRHDTPVPFPLRGDRVSIRPFHIDDAVAMHQVYGDPEVMRYVAHGTPTASPADSARMVAEYIKHQRTHGYACWLLVERGTGAVVGDVGFDVSACGVEFGYTLARAYWGRGLATEAGRLCVAAAFEHLRLPRLEALVDPRNPASRRVLDKLGFEFVGEREAYGRPHHEYRLTATAV